MNAASSLPAEHVRRAAPTADTAPAHMPDPSAAAAAAPAAGGSAADRFMRRLLRVRAVERSARTERDAHRGFRTSLIVSGVRCLISYLLIPILVPVIGFAGVLAAPVGVLLCLVAGVNGVYAVRRFWISDHRSKWMYTWFMLLVFAVLAVFLATDVAKIAGAL